MAEMHAFYMETFHISCRQPTPGHGYVRAPSQSQGAGSCVHVFRWLADSYVLSMLMRRFGGPQITARQINSIPTTPIIYLSENSGTHLPSSLRFRIPCRAIIHPSPAHKKQCRLMQKYFFKVQFLYCIILYRHLTSLRRMTIKTSIIWLKFVTHFRWQQPAFSIGIIIVANYLNFSLIRVNYYFNVEEGTERKGKMIIK